MIMMAMKNRRSAVLRTKAAPPRTLGTAVRLRPIKHRIPLYCLDLVSGDIKSRTRAQSAGNAPACSRSPVLIDALSI